MRVTWDAVGERKFETGVDRGVLYIPDASGVYNTGVAWNGLTGVTESPSGGESNKQYADNTVYLNLKSAEEFGATLEAFMYPPEFAPFDGQVAAQPGVYLGQQGRKTFGFSYRTLLGNDLEDTDHGYKLHLVYGCSAAPAEKGYTTVNDSPEPMTLSWEVTTTPVAVTDHKPTAIITIDSTEVSAADLTALEDILYGTDSPDGGTTPGVLPRLPLPDEVITLMTSP